jgi:hypothetical protein
MKWASSELARHRSVRFLLGHVTVASPAQSSNHREMNPLGNLAPPSKFHSGCIETGTFSFGSIASSDNHIETADAFSNVSGVRGIQGWNPRPYGRGKRLRLVTLTSIRMAECVSV